MARIKVTSDWDCQPYGLTGSRINFTLVSSPKEGRKQIRVFSGCRDYINDAITQFVNRDEELDKGVYAYKWTKSMPPIDLSKLRLLISSYLGDDTEKQLLYSAKRVLNMYEELAGFTSRSVLARVDHDNPRIDKCWLCTGPGEYMKTSHLVSWATLVFRVAYNHGGFEDLENIDQVEARFASLCDQVPHSRSDRGRVLRGAWPKARMFFERYNEIFADRDHKFFMPASLGNSWHGPGGIMSLATMATGVSHVDELVKRNWATWSKDNPFNRRCVEKYDAKRNEKKCI